jgi:hypothetical protein
MQKKSEIWHRRHIIRTLTTSADFQSRAFRGGSPVGPIFSGPTREAAILAVKEHLDQQAADYRPKRDTNGYPCVEEVRAALEVVRCNKPQEAMLLAHLNASDHTLTATELAQAAGYNNYEVANRQYGQLGRELAEELEWTPSEQNDGQPVWTFTLAQDADREARAQGKEVASAWRWQLRPEVVAALS